MVMGYSFLSPWGMKRLTQRAGKGYFSGESSIPVVFRVISGVLTE